MNYSHYHLEGDRATLEEDEGLSQQEGLILVRQPLEALMLLSAGHFNSIAILGETISTEQIARLLEAGGAGARVTLLWPLHVDIVPPLDALFPEFFIRLRRYEERSDIPSGFTAEEVRELMQ